MFPTLLGEVELAGAEELNRDLAAYIRQCEQSGEDYSTVSTVNNGWQSDLSFLETDTPAVRTLRRFIDQSIDAFLVEWLKATHGQLTPRSFQYSYVGWAVVLREGGFQHEHVHPRTDLVGIYYVQVPPSTRDAQIGDLTFTDPRSGRLASLSIWEAAQLALRPTPGKLLLFPGFVPHRVNQVLAQGERISINIDITLLGVP